MEDGGKGFHGDSHLWARVRTCCIVSHTCQQSKAVVVVFGAGFVSASEMVTERDGGAETGRAWAVDKSQVSVGCDFVLLSSSSLAAKSC